MHYQICCATRGPQRSEDVVQMRHHQDFPERSGECFKTSFTTRHAQSSTAFFQNENGGKNCSYVHEKVTNKIGDIDLRYIEIGSECFCPHLALSQFNAGNNNPPIELPMKTSSKKRAHWPNGSFDILRYTTSATECSNPHRIKVGIQVIMPMYRETPVHLRKVNTAMYIKRPHIKAKKRVCKGACSSFGVQISVAFAATFGKNC